jgi:hypothetical protein
MLETKNKVNRALFKRNADVTYIPKEIKDKDAIRKEEILSLKSEGSQLNLLRKAILDLAAAAGVSSDAITELQQFEDDLNGGAE